MQVQLLGHRTDLIFPRFEGEITDRGDYLVIRTPTNPLFYWGNYLLFGSPPGPGDCERWMRLFAAEIGTPPQVDHLVFAWDRAEKGDAAPFLEAGFSLSENITLAADSLGEPPHGLNTDIEISPARADADWQAVIDIQVSLREEGHNQDGYRRFEQLRFARYRRMSQAGRGEWFLARDRASGRVAACLGIFAEGPLARYQSVVTLPEFRRRGICSALLVHAARHALTRLGAQTLVIQADPEGPALNLYRSLGFQPVETAYGLERWGSAQAGEK